MRRVFNNVLLALVATVSTLGVVELGFRAHGVMVNRGVLAPTFTPPDVPTDGAPARLAHLIRLAKNPRRVYQLRSDISARFQGGEVATNALGWRNPSPVRPLPAAVRIVGIGDSVMFGQGVNDDETYLAQLERRLVARHPDRQWQVVNTGVPGYNTVMEVEALRDDGLAFEPHLVVVEFVGNDLGLPNFIREPEPAWAFDRSFLVDFVRGRLADRRWWRSAPPEQNLALQGMVAAPEVAGQPGEFLSQPDAVPESYRDMVGWEAYEGAMRTLASLAAERGFAVVWMYVVPGRQPLQDQAIALAQSLGFVVVHAEPALRRYLGEHGLGSYFGSPLAQGPQDGHPSARGHQVAAEALEQGLVDSGLLDQLRLTR